MSGPTYEEAKSRGHRRFSFREPAPIPALTRLAAYPWLVVFTTCLAAFAGQIDASIVQLGLPTLEREFDARLDEVSWVAVAYSLSFAAVLPVYARLAEIAGRKLMFVSGFALFAVFSALCGFAPSLPWLIVFRALQGMSGALLGANSVVILVTAAGAERRGRSMGIFAGAQAIGISVGPALGGVLLESLSWHWMFLVSVPFAALGAALGWLLVPVTTHTSEETSFDWPGALLLIPALTGLMLAITKLNAWGLLSAGVLTCTALSIVLFVSFFRRERRLRAPLLNLSLFESRAFSGGSVAIFLSYALLYGMFFAMSFALVRGYHDSPLIAGFRLTIVPVALGVMAPFAGGWAEKRPQLVMRAGMALCVVATIALTQFLTGAPQSQIAMMSALAVFGVGLGLFIAPNNTATLAAAPAERSGPAGGLLNLMRSLGTATGVAAASALLAWRLESSTGLHGRTLAANEHALLAAVGDIMLMLAAFALMAGVAASLGSPRRHATAISR
ncbi:MAG: MFS transporter [Acetobacteraceae bacterium]|nr:MFS transporter [Acetobacteraceae bacterium]